MSKFKKSAIWIVLCIIAVIFFIPYTVKAKNSNYDITLVIKNQKLDSAEVSVKINKTSQNEKYILVLPFECSEVNSMKGQSIITYNNYKGISIIVPVCIAETDVLTLNCIIKPNLSSCKTTQLGFENGSNYIEVPKLDDNIITQIFNSDTINRISNTNIITDFSIPKVSIDGGGTIYRGAKSYQASKHEIILLDYFENTKSYQLQFVFNNTKIQSANEIITMGIGSIMNFIGLSVFTIFSDNIKLAKKIYYGCVGVCCILVLFQIIMVIFFKWNKFSLYTSIIALLAAIVLLILILIFKKDKGSNE